MIEPAVASISLPDFNLWGKIGQRRIPLSFDLELTARCNNNCRHCYINLPKNDPAAQEREISFEQIRTVADGAVSLGALWCLLTGGEPLLRKDFSEIYLYLKKKGLLVSIFTNAALVGEEHVRLFKRYPPRDIEVSVYGTMEKTYERITRTSGSFRAFKQGLNLLLKSGLNVRLKAMALRSNLRELSQIRRFCRTRARDYFRFDPFLHLRCDGDSKKNRDIMAERLTPQEIIILERSDQARFQALQRECGPFVSPEPAATTGPLFSCGAGLRSFAVGHDGRFLLCPSLRHPGCVYDLKKGALADAWQNFVPAVRRILSENNAFKQKCRTCSLINLCLWCPANAHLETGKLDAPVDYFCAIAQCRAKMLKRNSYQG
ncbi:MAG: radical SAM protein [Thermodesulfobacteriota bacterium]